MWERDFTVRESANRLHVRETSQVAERSTDAENKYNNITG